MPHLPSEQALCFHPLGQTWPLSPSHLLLAGPKGAGSGEVLWGGGWGLSWGYPNPSHHAPLCGHHTASGTLVWRQEGGMALEMPCPCCWGVLGPSGGRTLLPCQQHVQNAAWRGSLQRRPPSPKREVPSTPLSSKSPQRGKKPQSVLVWAGIPICSSSGNVVIPGEAGILGGFCKAPKCPQDRLGFGGAADGYGRFKSRDPGSAQLPLSAEGGKGAHSNPGDAKCHHIPLTEPPPVSEPTSPHKGLICLQD